jgi:hypothetical protein
MKHESAERKFLHDVSNSVGSALFMSEVLLDDPGSISADTLEVLNGIFESLLTAKSTIEKRRCKIIEEESHD